MNNLQYAQNVMQQVNNPNPMHSNLLHVKPISHQIYRGINFIGTSIQQSGNPNELSGRIRIGFGKAVMAVGYTLNTVIALVETVAALTFAIIASTIHLSTKARFATFQKITLKIDAYFANTLLITGTQILCLKKGLYPHYHTVNALTNHILHGGAALVSQFIGHYFDHIAGRRPQQGQIAPAAERSIRLLIELAPSAIRDVAQGVARDFAVINNQVHNPNLQQFLQENPDHAQILNQFDFQRIRQNREYRQQLLGLAGNFFARMGILNNVAGNLGVMPNGVQAPQAANQINVFGVNRNEEDMRYQENLQTLTKRSFIEVHDTENLVRMLSREGNVENGREELTTFSTTIQLANYVQYQEIKGEVNCPEVFRAHELQEYNNRRQRILEAKGHLEQLNAKENEILIEMLFKTGDFNINAQGLAEDRVQIIQKLFNDIGQLAGQLHQGKLLAQKYMDMGELNRGNLNGAFGANNLFNGACQDAVKEIEARQPQV